MLTSLIRSLASGQLSDIFGRLRRAVIVYVMAILAIMCGLGFLLAAGFMLAERRFGPIGAAVGFGVVFLLVGIMVIGIYAAVVVTCRKRSTTGTNGGYLPMDVSRLIAGPQRAEVATDWRPPVS